MTDARVTKRRSPVERAFVFALLLTTSLVLLPARSEAAEKGPVDFSPGKANELFSIPKEMWSNINQFAFLVCYDEPAAKTVLRARLSALPGYSELYSSCQVWGDLTFPALQKLAAELSKGDTKQLLLRLQTAFDGLRSNPAVGRGEFDQAAESLNRKLAALTELSGRVNDQSMRFYKTGTAVIAAYRKRNLPDTPWLTIGPNLDNVGLAMGSMVGRWNMLTSNLAYLRKTLALPAGNAGIPELYDLDIEVGLNAWDEIAERAARFLGDAPAQMKYLSGENYYEACPLKEERWYVMKNSFLDGKGFILTAQRPGPTPSGPSHTAFLFMKPLEKAPGATGYDTASSQQWRFHRLTRGWWSIESRIRNDVGYPTYAFLLDGTPRIERVQGNVYGHPATKFWWRCIVQTPGWFRLVNANIGELQSLDTYNDAIKFFPGFMGSSTEKNYTGQYWRVEPAGGP